MFSRLKSVARVMRRYGPFHGVKIITREAAERYQDWKFGIDTGGVIYLRDFGVTNPDCQEYVATPYAAFREIMSHYDVRKNEDVFCDLGSGMGRGIILAATYPFRRVIGIEMIPQLHERALANIVRARRHLVCNDVTSVLSNAMEYSIPTDVTVLFLFNPFHGDVLRKVLSNLAESLRRAPRTVTLLVHVPLPGPSTFEREISSHSWIKQVEKYILPQGKTAGVTYTAAL